VLARMELCEEMILEDAKNIYIYIYIYIFFFLAKNEKKKSIGIWAFFLCVDWCCVGALSPPSALVR
jgi:hypothetical protein